MASEAAVKNRTWLARLSRNKLWNAAALIFSSAVLCTAGLMLAIGQFETSMFLGYFKNPLIFLLNYIPFLLLQLLFYCIWGRQYLAYLSSALILITASVGNYYKLYTRGEPFVFSDIGSITAGVSIASQYELPINTRIIIAVAAVILGALVLAFAAKGRPGRRFRMIAAAAVLASVMPLWSFVYSNDELYDSASVNPCVDTDVMTFAPNTRLCSKGFVYAFFYSIKDSAALMPDGYSDAGARQLLAQYDGQDIPEDKKVNLLIFQLESFTDLTKLNIPYDFEAAYERFHSLQEESVHGLLIASTYGGGTIKSEQSFLTGRSKYTDISSDTNSFIWYLRNQGYSTTGSHPYKADFYNRSNVDLHLGFEEYFFYDYYWDLVKELDNTTQCDSVFMPEVLRLFEEKLSAGTPVCSFNVTLQGHGEYSETEYTGSHVFWDGGDCSESVNYSVNNYLDSVYDTMENLSAVIDRLRELDEPVVLLIYGDHNPALDFSALGAAIDGGTEESFMTRFCTDYLIWANDAAKEALGNDFCGEGPTVSMNYLMSVLFDELGWDGSAYMQLLRDTRETISVIGPNGCYIENGVFCIELSAEGEEKYNEYEIATYYALHNFE